MGLFSFLSNVGKFGQALGEAPGQIVRGAVEASGKVGGLFQYLQEENAKDTKLPTALGVAGLGSPSLFQLMSQQNNRTAQSTPPQ